MTEIAHKRGGEEGTGDLVDIRSAWCIRTSQTCGLTLAFSRRMTQPDIRDDELGPTSHGELDLTHAGRADAPGDQLRIRLGRAHRDEVDAAVRGFVIELRDATSRPSRCFWRSSGYWPRLDFDRVIRRRIRRWSSSDSPRYIEL